MSVSRSPTREELVCLICHKPGVAFDHIKERSTHPQLRDDPANIAPLCPACHDLKSMKRIRTWVAPFHGGVGLYCWKKADSDVTIRIPVKVDTRYGCLAPMEVSDARFLGGTRSGLRGRSDDNVAVLGASRLTSDGAEPSNASGLELVQSSAPSPGAEGPLSAVPATDAGDDPLNGRQSPGQRPAPGVRKRQPSALTGPVSAAITGGAGGTQGPVAGGEDAVLEQGASGPPASLMVGEGEASQFLVVTPPSVDTPRVNAAAPRPSPSPASLTWEDWCEYGRCLRDQGELLQGTLTQWCFAVGDWIIEGEDTFGEMAHQLIDDIGLTYWKVATYASVARRVPPENRLCDSPKISFSHHQAVAALPAPEQKERLEQAVSEGMTVRVLREAVSGPVVAPETCICDKCGKEHRKA